MKAAIFYGANQPIKVQEIATPKIKPDEALARITSCGICGGDMQRLLGTFKVQTPIILGHEPAGQIEKAGEAVKGRTSQTAAVTVTGTGGVVVTIGGHRHGHASPIAQIVSDELGVDMNNIRVNHGDTNMLPWSSFTAGSRSAPLTGSAVLLSARKIKEKMSKLALFPGTLTRASTTFAGSAPGLVNHAPLKFALAASTILLTLGRNASSNTGLKGTGLLREVTFLIGASR